jgi:hypothetical protein
MGEEMKAEAAQFFLSRRERKGPAPAGRGKVRG